jgi:ERCC4-related helicase
VLKRFNEGVFNVLLATSIAEEGLDIAEVGL